MHIFSGILICYKSETPGIEPSIIVDVTFGSIQTNGMGIFSLQKKTGKCFTFA